MNRLITKNPVDDTKLTFKKPGITVVPKKHGKKSKKSKKAGANPFAKKAASALAGK